jgi:hypothetical protein
MASKKVVVKTGEKSPCSGIFRPSGGTSEFVFDEGEKIPPNKEGKRQTFSLVQKAKHKK